jgi:hypothetical protein
MNYELAHELDRGLDAIKKRRLKDNKVVRLIADLVHTYDIRDMGLLNETAEALLAGASIADTESRGRLSPQDLLDVELLTKKISPCVSEIRQKFFGKPEAPFPN